MPNGKITGTGYYVPENVVTNEDLTHRITTSDEWIRERSGIQERRFYNPEKDTVSSMATTAAKMALERANLDVNEIDAIILATFTPDFYLPGSGVLIQHQLGLDKKGVPSFDIRQACSGFVYGISMANDFIKAGSYKKVLVIGSEIQSTFLKWDDNNRHTAVLFADGAGAVVVEANEEEDLGIYSTHLHSDGSFAHNLMIKAPRSHRRREDFEEANDELIMDGRIVFKNAVTRFNEVINECLEANDFAPEDIDMLIPHQANLRIAEAVRKGMNIPEENVHNNIQKYGNTTAASIPIVLNEAWELGKIKKGDLVCLAAFGSGFTWGSCLMRWAY